MRIDYDSIKPIYIQVAEVIEDDIILGKLKEGQPVYSQLVLWRELGINPATVAKGINQLVAKGILKKQRGLSMIAAEGAKERLLREFTDGKQNRALCPFLLTLARINTRKLVYLPC